MFNQYTAYGYLAQEQKELSDNRYLTEISHFEKIYDFETAYKKINSIAGKTLEGIKKLICPNNLNIGVIKDKEKLEIHAWVSGKQIFGRRWMIPQKQ